MRTLSNGNKIYGFDELKPEAQQKAQKYINSQRETRNPYYYTVNDFEWRSNGEIFPNTNNINAC